MIEPEIPPIVVEERGHNPPLGILYLAAYLKEKTDNEVGVLDTQVEELDYTQIRRRVKAANPDLVGMNVMSFTLIDALNVAKIVKEVNPEIKVVLGGPHANIYPKETANLDNVDYVVLGEGEEILPKLVRNIDNKKNLKKIKGIVFKEKKKIVVTGIPPRIEELDRLPFPSRYMTPYKKYSSLLAKRSPITTMITSRGCPYNCLFCDRQPMGKIFRTRSAQNVVDEFEECTEMGIHEFILHDDTFTVGKKRVIEICKEVIRRRLDIGFDIRARVNTVDYEMLKMLKKAGCERIHYGVESGNQYILNVLRKGITIEQIRDAFRITKKVGIDTFAFFMIGSPEERRENIMETIGFAKQLNSDYVHFSITTPFPATDLYKIGLEKGILKEDYWQRFAENPTPHFKPEVWEENLTREELIKLLKIAYKSFYQRPSYIIRKFFDIRSVAELKRKAKAGLKVFGMRA
jgi:radical SAM superfamily enzyme YgiQ (UPF0313 family)